ncbi:MAG: rubrerythrin family protein [Candidatus Aenigmatarchaeota archaeon]
METVDNLKEAFSGESQARSKYLLYAKKAEEEGKEQVARVFRAAARAEQVHIRNHAKVLGMVKDTESNLKDAIEGENYEHTKMYPQFIDKAHQEGNGEAEQSFRWAKEVEEKHEFLYKKAKKAVDKDEDLEEKEMFVCGGCGYTEEDEAPERCPVCGAPKERFERIE